MRKPRHAVVTPVAAVLVGMAAPIAAACWAPAHKESSGAEVTPRRSPRRERQSPAVRAETSTGDIARYDLRVGRDGVLATLDDAGLPSALVDELDQAFVNRIDLFAHLTPGAPLSLWIRGDSLVAARVPLGNGALFAALYDGALAPSGFYDETGAGMRSAIRARPVRLSRITSGFGQRFDAFTGERSTHHGIDYGVPVGTPVVAVAAGRVRHAGISTSAGNWIELVHVGGFSSVYMHLSRFAQRVRPGAVVAAGELIGESGSTGRSTGPHLHYELRLNGDALDPTKTIPLPTTALGPHARAEHVAFMKKLEAIRDRRADQ